MPTDQPKTYQPEPFRHATPASVEAILDRLVILEATFRTVATKIAAERGALEILRAEIFAQRPHL